MRVTRLSGPQWYAWWKIKIHLSHFFPFLSILVLLIFFFAEMLCGSTHKCFCCYSFSHKSWLAGGIVCCVTLFGSRSQNVTMVLSFHFVSFLVHCFGCGRSSIVNSCERSCCCCCSCCSCPFSCSLYSFWIGMQSVFFLNRDAIRNKKNQTLV